MLQDGSYFDIEREVKLISKNYPVFGFLDCNRIVLSEEEDLLANASLASQAIRTCSEGFSQPVELTDDHKLALIFSARNGQKTRSIGSTRNFLHHF